MVGQRWGHGNGVHQKVKNRTLRLTYRTIYRTTNNFSILYRYIVGDFLLIFRTDIRATVCEIYKNECYLSTMYLPCMDHHVPTHKHTKNGKTRQPTAPHPSLTTILRPPYCRSNVAMPYHHYHPWHHPFP